jgi:hypothetical protein
LAAALDADADQIPFPLAPERVLDRTLEGSFFAALGGFFASLVSAVLTVVAVATVLVVAATAAAVAATAAAAVATASAVARTGEWVKRQTHIDADRWSVDADRWEIDPDRFPEGDDDRPLPKDPGQPKPEFPGDCFPCLDKAINGPASPSHSSISVGSPTITDEEATTVRAVVRDADGCCMPNQGVELTVDQGLLTGRLIARAGLAGEYLATFHGFDYSGPVPGVVRITLQVNQENGPSVDLAIQPAGGGTLGRAGHPALAPEEAPPPEPLPEPAPEVDCTPCENPGPPDPSQTTLLADKTELAAGESAKITVVLRDADGCCTGHTTVRLGVLGSGNQIRGGVQLVPGESGRGRYQGVFSFEAFPQEPRVGLLVLVGTDWTSNQVLIVTRA